MQNRHSAGRKPPQAPNKSRKARKMLLEGLENRLAMTIDGLGVAGDSWSDEYAAESYNYARNWAELLVSERGIDLGAAGDYADGRGANGTAFNWAETGATALDLLIQSQDIMISDQFRDGDVSHAVLMIGNSQFAPGGETFTKIADGTWSQLEIDNQVLFITSNIEAAISTLSIEAVKGLVATIPDPTMTPQGKTLFTPAGRAKVTTVVNTVNTKIKEYAAKYHQPVVDLAALSTAILGTPASPVASRTIGGNVYSATAGTPKTNLFIADGILPHTVFQAYVANAIIEGLNTMYNENIARLTEQQIVALAGQTYGGTDTFPVNYSNLIIQPPVTVYLDFGKTSTPSEDFTARMSELATARGIAQFTPDTRGVDGEGNPIVITGELSQIKNAILAKLQAAFAGTNVNFVATQPTDTRFEVIKLGRLSGSAAGPLTSRLGQSTFDWLNSSEISTGLVFPDLITFNATPGLGFDNINLATLSRADQLRYLQNVLGFYVANETGRGMGLSAADAYGYPSINSNTATNTAGVQLLDFMSGDPALGFNTSVFNGNPAFTFSPLAQAKLQYGRWLTKPNLATIAESGAAHDTTGTAQALSFVGSSVANQRVAVVKGARISLGSQKDLYKISGAAAGDKITAQTFSTDVYGSSINTTIRILAADGTTVLATSDNTLLGNNTIGQTGSTQVDTDSLVMNYVVATAGDLYVEVTAAGSTTGDYDLLVTNTVINNFPWQNQSNPLNVNDSVGNPLITAFDALAVINELNNPVIMNPVTFVLPVPTATVKPAPYLDVNGDNRVTAFDALGVINFLNANPIGPEFVPFSAGEATEPEAGAAERSSRSASTNSSGGAIATALPYSASAPSSFSLSNATAGQSLSSASEQLTWLLLNPVNSASEAEESSGCGSQEETALALEELLNEED